MRKNFYFWLSNLTTKHNRILLLSSVVITLVSLFLSSKLQMKTQIADMMPKGIPQVNEYMKITEDYSSASTVMITIESEEHNKQSMIACAEKIASRLQGLSAIKPAKDQTLTLGQKLALLRKKRPDGIRYDTVPLVKRIDYKIDNEFLSVHGMMIQKTKDLENTLELFSSIRLPDFIGNINNSFEKEFIDDADNLASLDGEEQAVQGLEGMRRLAASISHFIDTRDSLHVEETIGEFVTGPEYFFSPDNSMLLMMLQPTVSMNDFEEFMELGYYINDSLSKIQEETSGLKIGRAGIIVLQIDENEALKKDFGWSSLISLALILVLLIGSFKTWKNPLFAVITLVISLIWTMGTLYLVLRYLNMMSAAFGLILIGLGIDFGIHFLSGFKDARERGLPVFDAIGDMYDKVGSGVVTGALTTAAVFYMLAVTGMKAMTEMGIAVGTGIIVSLAAMMVLLPVLIVFFNKADNSKAEKDVAENFLTGFLQFRFLELAGRGLSKLPAASIVILVSALTVYWSYQNGTKLKFEYDMMKLEPEGLPSAITQDSILSKFEIASDYALLSVNNLEECRNVIQELKKMGNRTDLIGRIDGISEFLPSLPMQHENTALIEVFRDRVAKLDIPDTCTPADIVRLDDELVRLHQNIVEIGELSISSSGENNKIIRKCDKIVGITDEESGILAVASKIKGLTDAPELLTRYQRIMARILKAKILAMTSTEPVTLDNLPEEITKRYVNPKTGEMLVTIYPKGNIWDENILRKFTTLTSRIDERITGTPLITLLYIDLIKKNGGRAILFGTIAIVVLLLIDFRSITYTVLALIPLAVGTVWMVGLMALFSIKLNMANFMALPLIIGIGIDDGVHILHRYRLEGRGSIGKVMHFTGRAILLTSLTTMFSFGSMAFATHKGIASMGQVLCFGVGSCFISSAFLLPAIITIWEKLFNGKKRSC